jgi:hypothetical protein
MEHSELCLRKFQTEATGWTFRLRVDLEGLKKLRTMLEKYEGILQMMEHNDEAANWGGLRSVALCLLSHCAAFSRHFQHNTFGGLKRQ